MLQSKLSNAINYILDETAKMSTLNSPKRRKNITPLGFRLLKAFEHKGIEDKQIIAEKLGLSTDKAIYKIINGERELSFGSLEKFKKETGFSTDWLLFDEEGGNEMAKTKLPVTLLLADKIAESLNSVFEIRMREIAREELNHLNSTKQGDTVVLGEYEEFDEVTKDYVEDLVESDRKRKSA